MVFKIILAVTASLINPEVFHLCVLNCWHLRSDPAKLHSSDGKTLCPLQSVIARLEEEKASLSLAMADWLRDYQDLVRVKTGLSLEVATYR